MQRHFLFALVVSCGIAANAATLKQLSLDTMISQSTAIVRGTVTGSTTAITGPVIYTHYAIQVTERYKGASTAGQDVAVPGGAASHVRQTFPGAPQLEAGQEYVLFLWTGPSGVTQIMGLTQGLFTLTGAGTGASVSRPPAPEMMLNGSGQEVRDQGLTMPLAELRAHIAGLLHGGAK